MHPVTVPLEVMCTSFYILTLCRKMRIAAPYSVDVEDFAEAPSQMFQKCIYRQSSRNTCGASGVYRLFSHLVALLLNLVMQASGLQ